MSTTLWQLAFLMKEEEEEEEEDTVLPQAVS